MAVNPRKEIRKAVRHGDRGESSKRRDDAKGKSDFSDDRFVELRKEVTAMPLGELLSLKEHMPAKLYHKAIHEKLNERDPTDSLREEDVGQREPVNDDDNQIPTLKNFKRDNRKRPRELSAKKPVSVLRDVFTSKKRVSRDPRFDSASGQFDPHLFGRDYSFIKDMKREEYSSLRKRIKEEEDPATLEQLRFVKQRMENQSRSEQEEKRKKDLKREVRKTNMERMKQGKNPFYVKKSELKRRLNDERYEQLEKEGKLKKHQERREKKFAKKHKMRK